MTPTTIVTRHTEVADGLTALREFLLDHQDLLLGRGRTPCTVFICDGSDAENRAEVDRIAVILGVTADEPHAAGTTYEAVRHFGGGVTYSAITQSRKSVAEWVAANSYRGSVQPEDRVAA